MEYRVRWEIDVDAENPVEAARQARAMQVDPSSTANVFDVYLEDGDGEPTHVDLMEEGAPVTESDPPALAAPDPIDEAYRKAAKKQYHDEGRIEVDDGATVSKAQDVTVSGGAYVQAWVWVENDTAGICAKCGQPSDGCELCAACAAKE